MGSDSGRVDNYNMGTYPVLCACVPHSPAALARGYIEFFEPDVLVEAKPGLAAQIGVAPNELAWDFPTFWHSIRFSPRPCIYPLAMPFGLDSFGIYKAMYDRESCRMIGQLPRASP
jgi:hypothetical protein